MAGAVGASLLAILSITACSLNDPMVSPTTPSAASVTASAPLRICPAVASGAANPHCPPAPTREFRAVWVATVANIDWPSKPGLSPEIQRAEVVALLNRVQSLNMNAIVLQVRPATDAIYPSSLEPWAEWITGEQGRSPGYDPLAFWIDEAKKRGIEVHAWFNPYRARHTRAVSPNTRDHVSTRMPSAVKNYGGFQWLDPADQRAQDHSFAVIMDVLRRYDIDGVHFDDYFYPYPVTEQAATQPAAGQNAISNALNATTAAAQPREIDFPDDALWNAYVTSGGKLSRADWRRDNVNRFIERVYRGVKAEKPWVRVGISPFGIGRPDRRPPGIAGFSQYDKLYADVELWLQRGWLDYLAPQLYWAINSTQQSFPVLLDYWHSQNTLKRDLFPGVYTSRIDSSERSWQPKEIVDQIGLIRSKVASPQGHIHYSAVAIMQNRKEIAPALAAVYPSAAINTENNLFQGKTVDNGLLEITLNSAARDSFVEVNVRGQNQLGGSPANSSASLRGILLQTRYGNSWQQTLLTLPEKGQASSAETTLPKATPEGPLNAVAASVIDRYARHGPVYVRDVAQ